MKIKKIIIYHLSFIVFISFWAAKSVWAADYYVSNTGNDGSVGSIGSPWKTIQKGTQTLLAGDRLYIRGGQYPGIYGGFTFRNSGLAAQPITVSNFPGEQVVINTALNGSDNNYRAFWCWANSGNSWDTPKVDYVRIIGSDVTPTTLSSGVTSRKGIVVQGVTGSQSIAIFTHDCANWEIAGLDFIDTAGGIFNYKSYDSGGVVRSSDNWNVHDNRVYRFYRESGLQFNTDGNKVVNNEVYKVTNDVSTAYGCQMIDLLGKNNLISGNIFSKAGSTARCLGELFEWDLSDNNIVEKNKYIGNDVGIEVAGGDDNVIRNNLIYQTSPSTSKNGGIEIDSYDNQTIWPCNETTGAGGIIPPNNASNPDYQYYYTPRNCHSRNTKVYNNDIQGYGTGVRIDRVWGEGSEIRNNIIAGWNAGGVCYDSVNNGTCAALPTGAIVDHNLTQGNFGFKDLANQDFHLQAGSAAIDAGADLGAVVVDDFDGGMRPLGSGVDIGAYEFQIATPGVGSGDANLDGSVDAIDLKSVLTNYLKTVINTLNQYGVDQKINALDFVTVLKRLP